MHPENSSLLVPSILPVCTTSDSTNIDDIYVGMLLVTVWGLSLTYLLVIVFLTIKWNYLPYACPFLIHDLLSGLAQWVPLVEQELLTLSEHMSSLPVFSGVRITRSLVLYVCFVDHCLSFLYIFFWPLCCMFFFDIRILIAPLVSLNSSLY